MSDVVDPDRFGRNRDVHEDLRNLAAREQPTPVKNDHPHVADMVVMDIMSRKQFGMMKYGTALQPHNGRDALADAYQEALDLCKYLRQAIYERDGK